MKSGESLEQGFLGSEGATVPIGLERQLSIQAVRGPVGSGPPCAAARWLLGGPSLAVNLV